MSSQPQLAPGRWRDRAVALLPVSLTAWVALPFLRPDRWVTGFDTLAYSGPNLVVSLEEIRAGRIPQWNTEIFGGVTHIGNSQVAALEPLMWLASPLPVHRALLTIIVAHLVILATGMWWLLRRRLQLRPAAAALGAVAVVGSGLIMSRSIQFEQLAVVAWVPWVLVGCDLALDSSGGRRRLVVLPLAAALLAISGHPQQVLISIPLVLAWCGGRLLDHRSGWAGLARLGGAGVLALGLASAQLLPSALALNSSAIISERDISDASIPGHSAYVTALPGTLLGDVTEETHSTTARGFESMGFIGAIAGGLAVVGLLSAWRRPDRWAVRSMAVATAFGVLCALGPRTALYRGLYEVVPGFGLARVPGRWMLLAVIGASVIAAIGLDQIEVGRISRRALTGAAAALVAVVGTTWLGPFDRPSAGAVIWWSIAFAAVGAAVVVSRRSERQGPAAAVLVVVAALELGVMSHQSFARTLGQPRPFTELGDDLTATLADQPGRSLSLTDDRFSEPGYLVAGLRPNTNAALGVASIDGYDGGTQVTNRWVQAVSALVAGEMDPELTLRQQASWPISPTVSARLGIRWLLIDTNQRPIEIVAPEWGPVVDRRDTTVLLENPAWAAEAAVVHAAIPAPDESPAPALRSAPDDAVVLEEGEALAACSGRCNPTAATVRRDHPGAIDIAIPPGTAAGVVVVDEQLMDGWSAEVDGEEVRLVEANGMFVGVPVPTGAREVSLRYTAPGLRTGLAVSGLSTLVVLGLLLPPALAGRVRRRRSEPRG